MLATINHFLGKVCIWFVLSLQYGTTKKLYLISQDWLDRTTPNYSCESDFCCLFKSVKTKHPEGISVPYSKKRFPFSWEDIFQANFMVGLDLGRDIKWKSFFFFYERYWSSQLLLTPSSNFRLLTSFTSLRKLLLYIFQWGSGQH